MSPKKRSSTTNSETPEPTRRTTTKKAQITPTPPAPAPSEPAPVAKAKAPRKPRVKRERPAPVQPIEPAAQPQPARAESNDRLRIVMVASEAHPFAKTGGLAEVLGALPAALARDGHDVTVILPKYRPTEGERSRTPHSFALGSEEVDVVFEEHALPRGMRAVLVDVPELYQRDGLYGSGGRDYEDNAWRFAVLSRAAIEYVRLTGERPSVFHAHDWQAGLVPVYLKLLFGEHPVLGGVPTVFTIHNLAFQGVFPAQFLSPIGLTDDVFQIDGMEYWGQISYLKGGVNFAEKLTTVSPTYAREILTPPYGFGFDGVLRRREADLVGILNGIDTERWNPEGDEYVPARFSAADLSGKRDARLALLQEVGLSGSAVDGRPVIGIISRLTDQKGFDLVAAAAGELAQLDASWVMLASGEPQYEHLLRAMAARHPDRISATIGFDERLAHFIEAGADMFLMPSRYEPCGLNQLYSLRYGTVPIVRATGGLQDTVVDATGPGGNGFKFREYSPGAMVAAVRRAIEAFADRDGWAMLQRSGMARDSSWDVSAREYVKVYRGIAKEKHGI